MLHKALAFLLVCSAIAPAAEVISQIGAGQTYSTTVLWIADSYGVTDPADTARGEVHGSVNEGSGIRFNDSTPESVTLTHATNDRHDGTPNSGARVFVSTANHVTNYQMGLSGIPVTVDGLELNLDTSASRSYCVLSSTRWITVRGCIMWRTFNHTTTTATNYINISGGTSLEHRFENNIIGLATHTGTGIATAILVSNHNGSVFVNNTFILESTNATTEIRGVNIGDDARLEIRNNLSRITNTGGGTSVDYTRSEYLNATSSNNASGDGTSPNGLGNREFLFVDEENDDFHLHEDDTGARDQGIGPAAAASVPVVDIDLDPRSGLITDVGADQVVGVAPDSILIFQQSVD